MVFDFYLKDSVPKASLWEKSESPKVRSHGQWIEASLPQRDTKDTKVGLATDAQILSAKALLGFL